MPIQGQAPHRQGPPVCKGCGTERSLRTYGRQLKTKCWDKWCLCNGCAREQHPEDYRMVGDWLNIECTCPGCGLVHKNPYQQAKEEPTYTEAQWKFKMDQEAKEADAKQFTADVEAIVQKEPQKLQIPDNPENSTS
ncbi:hypothetical protein CL622_08845 [archaeon]|nr:hypothetical protein [archaeon]|tara:strand:- start:23 stop:430 length:408 start_codon:yes stop_codon:yes gene_type:complete